MCFGSSFCIFTKISGLALIIFYYSASTQLCCCLISLQNGLYQFKWEFENIRIKNEYWNLTNQTPYSTEHIKLHIKCLHWTFADTVGIFFQLLLENLCYWNVIYIMLREQSCAKVTLVWYVSSMLICWIFRVNIVSLFNFILFVYKTITKTDRTTAEYYTTLTRNFKLNIFFLIELHQSNISHFLFRICLFYLYFPAHTNCTYTQTHNYIPMTILFEYTDNHSHSAN